MAKLEFYTQRILPQAGPGVSLGAIARAGGDGGAAFGAAAGAIGGIARQKFAEVEKRREDEAAIAASTQMAQLRRRWTELEQKRQQEAQESGNFDGYAGRLEEEFRAEAGEVIKTTKSEQAGAWLRERVDGLGLSLFERGMQFEAAAKVERDVRLVAEGDDAGRVIVDLSPEQYSAVREERMLAYTRLPAEQRNRLWERAEQDLALSAGIGAVRRNPYSMLKALDAEPGKSGRAYVDNLGADGRLRLRGMAESEINRIEAEKRARAAEERENLRYLMQDHTAMAEDGIVVQAPISAARAAAAGLDPEVHRNYLETLKLAPDLGRLSRMSAAEMGEFLSSRDPAAGGEEGYATRAKVHSMLAQRAAAVLKAREDDPGAYLYRTSPSVKAAYEAMGAAQDPEAVKAAAARYAVAAEAEARRLGIQNPAILPKAYTDSVVAGFYQQEEGGEAAAGRIMAEREKWGPAWPKVFAQMAPDLPGTAAVIGTGMRTQPAARLAELGQLKDDEVAKLLPAGTSTGDVRTAVREELADMAATVAGQPGDAKLMGMLDDATYRLAVSYVAAGRSPSDAATLAASEVVNERYQFTDVRGGTIRVPVTVPEREVRAALRSIWNRDIEPLGYDRLDGAAWKTLPGDDGVALVYAGSVVQRPDGTPIRYTWAELQNRRTTDAEAVREIQNEARLRGEP